MFSLSKVLINVNNSIETKEISDCSCEDGTRPGGAGRDRKKGIKRDTKKLWE